MASFTMTLSEIAELHELDTVQECLPVASIFGLGLYGIEPESRRDRLNEKIIRHYWNREIAHETVDEFKMRMHSVMSEIMPYYNELYASTLIKFDPMRTIDIETVIDQDTSGTADSTSHVTGTASDESHTDSEADGTTKDDTSSSSDTTTHEATSADTSTNAEKNAKARAVSSEFPQNMLSGNGEYATGANDSVSDATDHTTGESSGTSDTTTGVESEDHSTGSSHSTCSEDSSSSSESETNGSRNDVTTEALDRTSKTVGMQAMPSQLLLQFRETIVNIDEMVVEHPKVQGLFMSILSTGDEYFFSQSQPDWLYHGYYPRFY